MKNKKKGCPARTARFMHICWKTSILLPMQRLPELARGASCSSLRAKPTLEEEKIETSG
jgi:hypothetical protein